MPLGGKTAQSRERLAAEQVRREAADACVRQTNGSVGSSSSRS
jgi:hypothetical protein